MSIFNTPELREFRSTVRRFLAEDLDDELREATRAGLHLPRALVARWQATLNRRGWGAPHWPEAAGGPGWDALQRYIFEEELAFADAPPGDVLGLFLAGPMLIAEGSTAQKERYLPGILSGQTFWCQGFSEPNAGSDLASLKTQAHREGDDWVITGQKTWLTGGHEADQMFLLARTEPDAKPQAGLSMFVIAMNSPGLTVSPIVTIDEGHSVNALFLDEVRVPADSLIGEQGAGWRYAKDLLARERVNNAQAPRTKRDIIALDQLARHLHSQDGQQLIEQAVVRRRLASLTADFIALESAVLDVLAEQMAGREPGPAGSTLKIRGSELQQRVTETAMSMLATTGIVLQPDYHGGPLDLQALGWPDRHLFRRVVTIYAGSNEIQKTIIAKSLLGM
jgi:alkylation response protein AidB-like acyl-CoA dehydrogenase